MSYQSHQRSAQSITARCAIVTLSDTRTPDTDKNGQKIRELLEAAGHAVGDYQLIPDDPARLASLLGQHMVNPAIDCIITNGGTGISRRDQTIKVIENLLEQPLPGFGELFRMLSYQQIASG